MPCHKPKICGEKKHLKPNRAVLFNHPNQTPAPKREGGSRTLSFCRRIIVEYCRCTSAHACAHALTWLLPKSKSFPAFAWFLVRPNSAGLSSTWNGDMLSQAIDDAQGTLHGSGELGFDGLNVASTPARQQSAPGFINSPGAAAVEQSPIPHLNLNLELEDRVLEENEAALLNALLEEEEEEDSEEEDGDEEGQGGGGSAPRRLLSSSLRSPLGNSLGLMALEEEEEDEER